MKRINPKRRRDRVQGHGSPYHFYGKVAYQYKHPTCNHSRTFVHFPTVIVTRLTQYGPYSVQVSGRQKVCVVCGAIINLDRSIIRKVLHRPVEFESNQASNNFEATNG